ncbi:uracil-DNA glycosylase [Spiroplasma alleghenense]|uniref:Uracil-DNA glycosylase n=1 Tax=Spiroplasma alleghenense TaxID=216931 RepID=A0A345Z276_9MOLU|nr:uracil-DNA glycosylase [Spiroplasma alleghenense]AXK50705.1 uracil-DNA glycosylase [Spiroplasma alleghenense]
MYPIKYMDGWSDFFEEIQKKPFFIELIKFLQTEYENETVFPPKEDVFRIFTLVQPWDISVIIIGQDPYHKAGLANGIAFSCKNNQKIPASLRNIFKELKSDLDIDHFANLDLENWVKQGVFLINSIMTVREKKPASHKNIGWEEFTEEVLYFINKKSEKIIYCLWGNFAKRIYNKIRYNFTNKAIAIHSGHPSPFSYHLFKNTNPFSKINEKLSEIGKNPIAWDK